VPHSILRVFNNILYKNEFQNPQIFHEAPHIAAQLYGVPHGILEVFNTILYENEFQNPQIFPFCPMQAK
jgi:hypothetical protein